MSALPANYHPITQEDIDQANAAKEKAVRTEEITADLTLGNPGQDIPYELIAAERVFLAAAADITYNPQDPDLKALDDAGIDISPLTNHVNPSKYAPRSATKPMVWVQQKVANHFNRENPTWNVGADQVVIVPGGTRTAMRLSTLDAIEQRKKKHGRGYRAAATPAIHWNALNPIFAEHGIKTSSVQVDDKTRLIDLNHLGKVVAGNGSSQVFIKEVIRNPDGQMSTAERMEAMAEILQSKNAHGIDDAVYAGLQYPDTTVDENNNVHVRSGAKQQELHYLRGHMENADVCGSLAKVFAYAGAEIGYVIARDKAAADRIRARAPKHGLVPTSKLAALAAAMQMGPDFKMQVAMDCRDRVTLLQTGASTAGFENADMPPAGQFFFPSIEPFLGREIDGIQIKNGMNMVAALNGRGVFTSEGTPSGDPLSVRMSTAGCLTTLAFAGQAMIDMVRDNAPDLLTSNNSVLEAGAKHDILSGSVALQASTKYTLARQLVASSLRTRA